MIIKTHCVLSTRNMEMKDILPLHRELPREQVRAMEIASSNLGNLWVSRAQLGDKEEGMMPANEI